MNCHRKRFHHRRRGERKRLWHEVKLRLGNRDAIAETSIAINTEYTKVLADILVASNARHTCPTGNGRIDNDGPTCPAPSRHLPDNLMTQYEGHSRTRVLALDDVKIGPA